jgi:hypothetical protein
MSTALRSVGFLDVLSSTPAESSRRAPFIQARLRRFATKLGKKCGLGIILAVFFASGCHKNPARPNVAPASTAKPAPPVAPPVPMPATWPELPLPPPLLNPAPEPNLPRSFSEAEASFLGGRYAESIPAYEKYLREDDIAPYRATALFRLGLAQILSCGSDECRQRTLASSREFFRRLVSLYPTSPYSAEARALMGLAAYVERLQADAKGRDERLKKLTDELDRLKKIDLERQPAGKKK